MSKKTTTKKTTTKKVTKKTTKKKTTRKKSPRKIEPEPDPIDDLEDEDDFEDDPEEDRQRKTLEEMIQAGNSASARVGGMGLKCPNCHCRDLRVGYTRHGSGRVKRVRVCRHCGRRVATHEVIV